MKFSVYKSDMLDALKLVAKAVAVKPSTPILSNILLQVANSQLELQANNFAVGTLARISAYVEAAGATCAGGKRLLEIVARMPEDTITFELVDNLLQIKSGGAKFELLTADPDDFPEVQTTKGTEFEIPAGKLKEIVTRVSAAAGKDDNRPVFKGVCLEMSGGMLKATATNTHRLHHFHTRTNFDGDLKAIIPADMLKDLAGALPVDETPVKIAADLKSATFQCNNFMTTARLIEGMLPPFEKVMNPKENFAIEVNRGELKDAIGRVSLIAKDSAYNSVALEVEKDNLTVTAKTESSTAQEDLEIEGGEDLKIGFNYQYLLDLLAATDDKKLRIGFGDKYSPIKCVGVNDENFIGIVTPLNRL